MSERARALREAADFAEFYAEERMTLCSDSILHDPLWSAKRGEVTAEMARRSRELQIDGTINSAAYHAALHIAAHLRALADDEDGNANLAS